MYNRTGGPVGPFLLCSHTKTKGGEGRLKGRGVHHRKGERGVGPLSMGPGQTQAGSSSGEGGTLPGLRPGLHGHPDSRTAGFTIIYGRRGYFCCPAAPSGETAVMASESISYHDTILGRVWEGGGRGNMEVVP